MSSSKPDVEMADIPIPYTMDTNYSKHVLWGSTLDDSDLMGGYNKLFSKQNVDMISKQVSLLLDGVDPQGRQIIYPDDKIVHVLNQLYENSKGKKIGDIFSRFHISGTDQARDDVLEINQQTINLIYTTIKNEIEMIECNNKLDKFDTIFGDHNRLGLRRHPKIYATRQRKPNTMEFHMRY